MYRFQLIRNSSMFHKAIAFYNEGEFIWDEARPAPQRDPYGAEAGASMDARDVTSQWSVDFIPGVEADQHPGHRV